MQFWLTLFCYQFFALLLIVFALEVTAGVMGYVYKDKVQILCWSFICNHLRFVTTYANHQP